MRTAGFWSDQTLLDVFLKTVRDDPARLAVTAYETTNSRRTILTCGQLEQSADRIAANLLRLGVKPGEVVSFQLPNWWQFVVLHIALLRIGAVTNPVMPIFRDREMEFMLSLAETRVLIVPQSFRDFDYAAMADRLKIKVPSLEHIVVIGSGDSRDFEAVLNVPARLPESITPGSADTVVQLLYTSGTTGEPKGVMHTGNTLLNSVRYFEERIHLTAKDVVLMASPMAHQTGFLVGLLLPLYLGGRVVLQDIWNPTKAADIIEAEQVTMTMASTPFLADLTAEAERRPAVLRSLRTFVSAGAPIPRILVRRATQTLCAHVISGWGMTENGLVTTTKLDDTPEKVFETDGYPSQGMEVRIVDHEDKPAPDDKEGRLQARGPGTFVGYLKRPQLYAVDEDGWFETGDLARKDKDGYIRITGRSKDIIIRGGENVPVIEIEQLMYRHPAVQEVAIVGLPDERLGERACACVVLREGTSLTSADLSRFMAENAVAKNYWPERLEVLDALPKTPSGKVQKFKLREIISAATY
ncbi:AMP-binding protein [Reyranella sp.]|uniref:AMP-binding protein n=1 Tax=Reyranella sp. TaxID=1929291 RepID=UPI002732111B|nr:AMP-binding protein [Reyranella sp.]MDP2375467.1 AMP-binding protein [Reyranella sp.]